MGNIGRTVAIPRELAGPASELPDLSGFNNQEYGKGDPYLDRKLEAIRQRRSNALMEAVINFVEDPTQKELINLGRGPGNAQRRALTEEELDQLVAAGAGTQGIFTVTEPADLDLYRSFVTAPLEMPEQPLVGTTLLDMNGQASTLTRFQEGRITIRAKCPDGVEAWLLISTPVPALYYCREGGVLGWPKYVADEMSVGPERAEVRYDGSVRYSLDFTPGPVDDEAALRALGRIEGTGGSLSWHWLMTGGGSVLTRSGGGGGGQPARELAWQTGMVKVYMRPEDRWSGLIPEGCTTPGFYSKWIGGGGGDSVRTKICTVMGGEIIYPPE